MRSRLLTLLLALVALRVSATPAKVLRHRFAVPAQYLVAFTTSETSAVNGIATSLAAAYGLEVLETFPYSLRGALVRGAEQNILALSDDPRVLYVEQNAHFVHPDPRVSATQWTTYGAGPNTYQWNLDRLDELSRADRDSTYNMCTEGRSVYAYVLDYSVKADHAEFEVPSRVVLSKDFYGTANGQNDTANGCPSDGSELGYGYHGTAVASVLAGTHIGAAKPQVVSLRIFGCNRFDPVYTSDIIEAMNWIGSPANPYRTQPGVINMSAYTPPWDGAFAAVSDAAAGIVETTSYPFFVSANNFSTSACKFSPAAGATVNRAYSKSNRSTGRVFVVGATSGGPPGDNNDYRWQTYDTAGTPNIGDNSGSNSGACVSIYAPGDSISFAAHTGTNQYRLGSGTSFASPHAAAVAARYIQKQVATTGIRPTYTQIYDFLLTQAQTVVINTTTPPGYWMCVQPNGAAYVTVPSRTSQCPTANYTAYPMPQASNNSDARMLYWDEGVCWP
jgi:hypothetical protein